MADPLENLDEALEAIEKASIKTTQGSFIRVEEVRRLLTEKKKAREEEAEEPQPKTMNEAKQAAKRDPDITAAFADRKPDAGRAIGADA